MPWKNGGNIRLNGLNNSQDKLCIVICSSYKEELEKSINNLGYSDVVAVSIPGSCGISLIKWKDIKQKIDKNNNNYNKVIILGGMCSRRLKVPPKGIEHYQLILKDLTIEHVINSTVVQNYIQKGAYIICSNLLKNWKQLIGQLKFQGNFFGDSNKNLIFFNTGLNRDLIKNLKEFSSYVNIPYEIIEQQSIGSILHQITNDSFRISLKHIFFSSKSEIFLMILFNYHMVMVA